MGDRSNVFIQQFKDGDEWQGIGIYSHWGGESMTAYAAEIARGDVARSRLGDETYFARIVVQNVLDKFCDADSATGGGLWIDNPCDNEHPILVINALTGELWYADESAYRKDKPA